MALDIKAWVYTGDNGQAFQTGVASYIVAQVDGDGDPIVGGHVQTGVETLYSLPRGMTPRSVTVSNADGLVRSVVCLSEDAPLFTGAVGTINLQDGAGVVSAYTRSKPVNEKSRTRLIGQ